MIQCVGASYCIYNLFIIYLLLKKHYKRYYAGTFDVPYGMFNNAISLVLGDSETDSENIILIWRSVSDGQKTCSSMDVSLIDV